MNNNYHTQLDKSNNMLQEIAASKQLLQQPSISNIQGTPINKSIPPMNPQTMAQMNQQYNPQLNQQFNPQLNQQFNPQLNQQLNSQLNPQLNPQVNPQLNPQAMQQMMQYYQQQQMAKQIGPNQSKENNEDDELELSDGKPEPKQVENATNVDTSAEINQKIQQLISNQPPPENAPTKVRSKSNKLPYPPRNMMPPMNMPYFPENSPPPKNKHYILIPILLIVAFIFLVHPKTSSMLGKYLPSMNTTKGIVIRGVILALFYVIVSFILKS